MSPAAGSTDSRLQVHHATICLPGRARSSSPSETSPSYAGNMEDVRHVAERASVSMSKGGQPSRRAPAAAGPQLSTGELVNRQCFMLRRERVSPPGQAAAKVYDGGATRWDAGLSLLVAAESVAGAHGGRAAACPPGLPAAIRAARRPAATRAGALAGDCFVSRMDLARDAGEDAIIRGTANWQSSCVHLRRRRAAVPQGPAHRPKQAALAGIRVRLLSLCLANSTRSHAMLPPVDLTLP